jgi:chitinase
MTTITPALPISTGTGSNHSFPAMNGSEFTPPAPWTKPYIASDAYKTSSVPDYSGGPDSSATLASTAETVTATASPYIFNAEGEDNVAVYYGTTPATTEGGLTALCNNPNVDIVILSFVFSFFDANGYPSINFGPGCSSQTSAQADAAPGLKDCSALAPEITACQAMDKKVLLSLGGYNSNTSFASETQATTFASTLWNLFGAGDSLDAGLRPFGTDVIVDGFDLDNEDHSTEHYETFATALRERFTTDDSKTYYLSAAPQCPIPDESIPLGALQQADFVWVQFYNNPSCNIDTPGFRQSFQAWSDLLASGTQMRGPRLYIGAAGFEGAGSGYVKGSGLGTRVRTARGLYVENFGGVMLWDGSEAALNVDQHGVDYLEYAKTALH